MFAEYYLNIAFVICTIAVLSSMLCASEMVMPSIVLSVIYIWYVFHYTNHKGFFLILGALFLLLYSGGCILSAFTNPKEESEEDCPDCNGTGMVRETDYHANIPGCYVDLPCTRCGGHTIPSRHIAAGYYSEPKNISGSGRIKVKK